VATKTEQYTARPNLHHVPSLKSGNETRNAVLLWFVYHRQSAQAPGVLIRLGPSAADSSLIRLGPSAADSSLMA